VIEWAWEEVDEATARWCFERLGPDDEPGWLHRRRDEWVASGRPWRAYLQDWAESESIHTADSVVRLLDRRFYCERFDRRPYFFPELSGTTAEEEQAAIDARTIRATRIDYVGRRPRRGRDVT